ncbi:GNAT family N-acetyltransferase [Flavobacterium sp. NRK F7]|nr:GNAT family N-acetyltransferase [Flavobacterium sp. NRK F7]
MMNTTQINIKNLTSLWKEAALVTGDYTVSENTAIATINKGEWPNRIWSQKSNEVDIEKIKQLLENNKIGLTYAYFKEGENDKHSDFSMFRLKSIQYGMSLRLDKNWDTLFRLSFQEIEDKEGITMWTSNFEKAFGYSISDEVLQKTKDTISFFTITFEGERVGTVALYVTETVAGIHCLGVIPAMRGKGFAREIMQFVLNLAQKKGATIAVLQASERAKELYLSMGFQQDFLVYNYIAKL